MRAKDHLSNLGLCKKILVQDKRQNQAIVHRNESVRKKMPFFLKEPHLFFESLGTRVFWQAYNLFFKASDVWSMERTTILKGKRF